MKGRCLPMNIRCKFELSRKLGTYSIAQTWNTINVNLNHCFWCVEGVGNKKTIPFWILEHKTAHFKSDKMNVWFLELKALEYSKYTQNFIKRTSSTDRPKAAE